jgi:hypothetical protein
MPKVYLNEDMNKHLRSLLEEKSKRISPKTSSRDLMFQSIASSIFSQLLTDCLIHYKRNLMQEEGVDITFVPIVVKKMHWMILKKVFTMMIIRYLKY